MKIVIDTREQTPLKFRTSKNVEGTVVKALNTGDYSIEGMEHLIAIERKSAADLYGSLGKGNARFQRELSRAALNLDYFAIIIENPYICVRDKLFKGSNYSKMRSDVVLKILWTLMHKYHIQVMFCNGPVEASSIVRGILMSYYNCRKKKPKFCYKTDIDIIERIQEIRRKISIKI